MHTTTTRDQITAETARLNPWWLWALLAIWVLGTLTATLLSLLPRPRWYEKLRRWISKAVHWAFTRIIGNELLTRKVGDAVAGRQYESARSQAREASRDNFMGRQQTEKAELGTEMEGFTFGSAVQSERGARMNIRETGWRQLK